MRDRQREATFGKVLRVRSKRLLNAAGDLLTSSAQSNDTWEVRQVRTPCAVFGLLVDDYVLAQRRCSKPLAFLMLPSVPTGTVALSLPATTIRSGRWG